jgi:hypothetical protein
LISSFQKNRISLILGGILAFSLVVSLFLFLYLNHGWVERVLFFPRYTDTVSGGETRRLPKRDTREEELMFFLEEIILGPTNIENIPIVPEETELRSVMFRDQVLYLDLSEDILFQTSGRPLPLERRMALIKRSVLFNFPWVKEIIITINGEIPFEGPADLADNFREN